MRHGMTWFAAAVTVLTAATALPAPANAQYPGRLLRMMVSPLGMIVPRVARPRFAHRGMRVQRGASSERTRAAALRPGGAAVIGAGAAMLWPSASTSGYEEIVGYALLPNDYGQRFW